MKIELDVSQGGHSIKDARVVKNKEGDFTLFVTFDRHVCDPPKDGKITDENYVIDASVSMEDEQLYHLGFGINFGNEVNWK